MIENSDNTYYLKSNERIISFYIDQFKDSSFHIRHLENLRATYLAFFFTVVFGSLTAITNLVKDINLENIS
ncbi:MAG TPA: hypothetical protein DCF68_02385 [Cyanothece sp. UBA12306]|nr:hypothetical protein [Cyanothece sp. UBA12306]